MTTAATLHSSCGPGAWALAAALLLGCASAKVAAVAAPAHAVNAPAAAAAAALAAPPGTPDRELGLSKGSVFDVAEPLSFAFSKESPGGNDRLPGAYPGAPPRIPHEIQSYLPITIARNACFNCHDVEKANTPEDPTPVPASHHFDLRNAPGVKQKKIAGARWVCTTCHVPQALVSPPIGNGFHP